MSRHGLPKCESAVCGKPGTLLCDYPVKRRGRKVACGRRICQRCASRVGSSLVHCPPHAKLYAEACAKSAAERRERAWWDEFLAGFSPPLGKKAS